jgi:hypothetical protein
MAVSFLHSFYMPVVARSGAWRILRRSIGVQSSGQGCAASEHYCNTIFLLLPTINQEASFRKTGTP